MKQPKAKKYRIIKLLSYTVPLYGNKHLNAYGSMIIKGKRGKPTKLYYEVGKVSKGYYVDNIGSLYYPLLTVESI